MAASPPRRYCAACQQATAPSVSCPDCEAQTGQFIIGEAQQMEWPSAGTPLGILAPKRITAELERPGGERIPIDYQARFAIAADEPAEHPEEQIKAAPDPQLMSDFLAMLERRGLRLQPWQRELLEAYAQRGPGAVRAMRLAFNSGQRQGRAWTLAAAEALAVGVDPQQLAQAMQRGPMAVAELTAAVRQASAAEAAKPASAKGQQASRLPPVAQAAQQQALRPSAQRQRHPGHSRQRRR